MDSSYAIVNGEIARVGDQIGEYQVLRIEKKKIIFIKDGEPLEIELKGRENEKTKRLAICLCIVRYPYEHTNGNTQAQNPGTG